MYPVSLVVCLIDSWGKARNGTSGQECDGCTLENNDRSENMGHLTIPIDMNE